MKTEEEIIKQGYRVYDRFCKRFSKEIKQIGGVITPSTSTATIFALLQDANEYGLLMRVMMEEFLENLPYEDIRLRYGVLYKVQTKYIKI